MRARVIVIAMTMAGCGSEPVALVDAGLPPDGDAADAGFPNTCPPYVKRQPKGSATLGTGRDAYEPMPEVLPMEYGTQDGFNLVAHVRMTGFDPGDPLDFYNPRNPRTRILAYLHDTNTPLNSSADPGCPYTLGYVPVGDGTYQFRDGVAIIFDTCWRAVHLFGKRIRIELEIEDETGGYTHDTRIVTGAPPSDGFYPREPDHLGCQLPIKLRPPLQDP